MGIRQEIQSIIEQELEGSDYFIVSVKVNETESHLRFYIDGVAGVGISICARLSRKVAKYLEEKEIDQSRFQYEISSPGVDNPLLDKRQYKQHIGRHLEVLKTDDQCLSGKLTAIEEDHIEIESMEDKKKKTTIKQSITFKDIKNSTVQISFKSVRP